MRTFACMKCYGIIGEVVEQEEQFCICMVLEINSLLSKNYAVVYDVETLRKFTYLGDKVTCMWRM